MSWHAHCRHFLLFPEPREFTMILSYQNEPVTCCHHARHACDHLLELTYCPTHWYTPVLGPEHSLGMTRQSATRRYLESQGSLIKRTRQFVMAGVLVAQKAWRAPWNQFLLFCATVMLTVTDEGWQSGWAKKALTVVRPGHDHQRSKAGLCNPLRDQTKLDEPVRAVRRC